MLATTNVARVKLDILEKLVILEKLDNLEKLEILEKKDNNISCFAEKELFALKNNA